jgi:hypothetical protein
VLDSVVELHPGDDAPAAVLDSRSEWPDYALERLFSVCIATNTLLVALYAPQLCTVNPEGARMPDDAETISMECGGAPVSSHADLVTLARPAADDRDRWEYGLIKNRYGPAATAPFTRKPFGISWFSR